MNKIFMVGNIKWFLLVSFCIALTNSKAYAIDIVSDPTHMAETIAGWGKQASDMAGQLEQLQATVSTLQNQYNAITGTRNLGDILNNPLLRDYLPPQMQQVYDSVQRGGFSGLTGSARSIRNASKIFDSCNFIIAEDERDVCEARAVKGAQDKDFATQGFNQARERMNQIDGLMNKINQTKDQKAIEELSARIQIEQANLQNEAIKLQMYEMLAKSEDRLQEQRQKELNARVWANRSHVYATPLTFD
jgi:type IV secretion system protein VirB5